MIGGFLFRHKGSAGAVCAVYERPDRRADVGTRADELAFVREGFSWPVALAAPLVLLMRGAWLALAGYAAAVVAVLLLSGLFGLSGALPAVLILTINFIFAFEAAALERWSLERSGWNELAVVSGSDQADCERRFFDTWLPQQSGPSAAAEAGAVSHVNAIRRLFSTGR